MVTLKKLLSRVAIIIKNKKNNQSNDNALNSEDLKNRNLLIDLNNSNTKKNNQNNQNKNHNSNKLVPNSHNMKKSIRHVFWVMFFLVMLLIYNLVKFVIFDATDIVSNSYNPRVNVMDSEVKRGDIKDFSGEILATSVFNNDAYNRVYPEKEIVATITGAISSSVKKIGIESSYNFELETIENELLQRTKNVFTEEEIIANSVVTTIDLNLQKYIYSLLKNQKGAVVVSDSSTGEILSIVSNPSYDPNLLEENFYDLESDDKLPLLNRATSGVYPPGSTFKLITTVAAMRTMDNFSEYTYVCCGSGDYGESHIPCYNGVSHGEIGIIDALKYSCNTFFAEVSTIIGGDAILETANSMFLNEDFYYIFTTNKSNVSLDGNSPLSELSETAIGQGKTVVTPLYMNMFTSAIANGGLMMKPYLMHHIETESGKRTNITIPEKIGTILYKDEVALLKDAMKKVVDEGTGKAAAVIDVDIYGKTGTAQTSSGLSHSWFCGFKSEENKNIAVTVILENAENNMTAASVAGDIFEFL